MYRIGLPVPPFFTVTTEACNAYLAEGEKFPAGLWEQELASLKQVEEASGKKFGDPSNPLLVSCRSGAKFSMPGMMDTVLNLGLNDRSVEGLATRTGNPRFALDSYRRFIQMFGDVVAEVGKEHFEKALTAMKARRRAAQDVDLSADDLRHLAEIFKDINKRPQRPTWLSSEHRTLSDIPPVLTPAEEAALAGRTNGSGAPSGAAVTPGDPATEAAIDARAAEGAGPTEHPPTETVEVPEGGRVEP